MFKKSAKFRSFVVILILLQTKLPTKERNYADMAMITQEEHERKR